MTYTKRLKPHEFRIWRGKGPSLGQLDIELTEVQVLSDLFYNIVSFATACRGSYLATTGGSISGSGKSLTNR